MTKKKFSHRYDKGKVLAKLIMWPSTLRIHVLHCISLTEKIFRECFSFEVLPSHMGIVMAAHILGNYAALRLFDESSTLVYAVWPLIVVIAICFETMTYTIAGAVFESSKLMLFSAKRINTKENGRQRRQFMAIRPVRVQIGHFFPLDRSTLFNFWLIVVENTITVLFI